MDVKQLREKLSLSQEDLSKVTGIPRDRISKWEQGKGAPKTQDQIKLGILENRMKEISDFEIDPVYHRRILQELEYGFKLRDYREKNKLTYDDMAAVAGVPTELYFNMENGNVDFHGAYLKPLWEKTGIKLPEVVFPDNNDNRKESSSANDLKSKPDAHSDRTMDVIDKLISQNEILVKSTAEAISINGKLAETNGKLAERILEEQPIVRAGKETPKAFDAIYKGFQEFLLDVATGEKYLSREEAAAALMNKFVPEDVKMKAARSIPNN